MSLGVAKEGQVVKANGYGMASVELNALATERTVYQLQSISKSFTATAIMLLNQEGKLNLDDAVTSYLDGLPEAWKGITLRHLLSMASGIPDFIRNQGSQEAIIAFAQGATTPEEIICWPAERPLQFRPGEGFFYSNTNYYLLGLVINRVTGKPYGELLKERIFEPLGMMDTRMVSLLDIIPNRAAGYIRINGPLQNGYYMTQAIMESASGGLYSMVLDMVKWDAALYTDKILERSILNQMWTPTRLSDGTLAVEEDGSSYGLGWDLSSYKGHRVVGHGGDNAMGFTAKFARFPNDQLTITVLTNLLPVDSDAIVQGIANHYILGL